MAFVTENRRSEGLLMNGAIADNIALVALRDFSVTPAGLIEERRLGRSGRAGRSAQHQGGLARPAGAQSLRRQSAEGGSGQALGLAEPSIFILDEPTRGVDVGAKFEIYTIIERLAAAGGGILFISSELDELLAGVGTVFW